MGSQRVWHDWVTSSHGFFSKLGEKLRDGTQISAGLETSKRKGKGLLGDNHPSAWILALTYYYFCWVQFSHSVVSDSLQPHGLQHAKPPCPSPAPRPCSNSCPLSWWCHPTISSSLVPFSSCLQSCPASGSFPMSQFFASGGQTIAGSASVSVLPMNIQGWFPLGLPGLISLQSKGLSRSSPTEQFKSISSSVLSLLYGPTITSICDY